MFDFFKKKINTGVVISDLEYIYNAMSDKLSKDILLSRWAMRLDGTYGRLLEVMSSIERRESLVDLISLIRECQYGSLQPRMILYGSGEEALAVYNAITYCGVNIEALCIDDDSKPNLISNLKRVTFEELGDRINEYYWICGNSNVGLTTWNETEGKPSRFNIGSEFHKLRKQGIDEERIILRHMEYAEQYFGSESVLIPAEDEVFIDAGSGGAQPMSTAIAFRRWCQDDFEHLYCFEPQHSLYEACSEQIKTWSDDICKKVNIYEAGLWEKSGIMHFAGSGGNAHVADKGDSIKVMSVDELLQGQRVTTIKMDIEGSELSALKGAEQSICKWRPKLIICIYHKLDDCIEIPQYILKLHSDYRMYIRHYSTCSEETVLYCI